MKNASQAPGLLRSRSLSFLFMLVTYCSLLLMPGWARGQTKILANEVTYTSPNTAKDLLENVPLVTKTKKTVEEPNNALTDDDSYARLIGSPGLLLGLGSFEGVIELKFPSTLPANTWSYVRIQGDGDLFKALLGGSLGNVLGVVLNAVLIGGQEMEFDARLGANSVLKRSSTQGFGTDNVKLLIDADGSYVLAMRPASGYDRIRITNKTGSLLGLGTVKTLDVYNAFYYEDNNKDCGRPFFTSFDGTSTGLTLDVLPIDNGTIKYAIDTDPNTFTTLKASSVLGLSVAGSISQNFYFPTATDETSTANIKLALGSGGLLDLKVLSGIDVIFKNNGQTVATKSLSSGLLAGTNLLGLLQNGQPVTLTFGLGAKFDQIEIRSSALVGLSLAAPDIKIYDVQRYDGVTCVNPNIVTPTPTSPMLSQKNCAVGLIAHQHANFPTNTIDGNNDTYTTLEASSGIAVGVGAYNGFVEMGFATPVAAGKTTYVRIDFDNEVLGGLLNGSVGGLLNGVVGNVLFGNHYFTIEGKSNGAVVYSRSSNDGLSSIGKVGAGGARIVQDKNGHYYIAITPDVEINSVRITENLGALVGLGTVKTMNVYHACHATGAEPCEQGFATFSESSGITLDLLGLGAAGVTEAQNAIDLGSDGKANLTTASKISVGAVGIAGTMMQHVQFHGLSTDRDHFRVKMKMQNNGVVTANVLGSIIVKAYDGEQEVYSQRLNERLIPGLDLLNLLSSGQMVNLPFAPGKSFDRVAVGIASLVDANIISVPLEIYSIERFSQACPDPELKWDPKTTPPFKTPACVDEVTSFENVNFPYEAITDNPSADTYATLTAGAGVAAGLGSYSSHIELKYSGIGAAAHEVSYIRVDTEGNLFKALLGGSLGNTLGNVLGSVALGNQYIVVQAKDAVGNPVGTAHSSVAGFNSEFVKLVKDKDGKFYLAVTAAGAYQSVRIEYHHTALVGAMGSSALKVYSMCRETEFDACEQATFTSWDGNGIALDIADLTKGGVANPEFALDGSNSSNYSTLNVGIVGVGASVSQKVYFKTKSDITDELRVRLQLANPGILNLDLFGNTKLIFYDGEQNVKEMTLASGLINNIDLLGLFNSGGVQSFTFAPGVAYNRVELRIETVVGVNTSAPIRLYGMSRITAGCPDPDFLSPNEVFKSPVCADGVELGNVRAVDDVTNAVDGDYNTYANMRSDAGAIFGIGNKESILELKYGAAVGANTTSYLRIGDDAGILESLLSGSIGEAVYGLLNNVALGDNYFVVRAKNGANKVLEGSSRNGFADANGLIKIVQDKAGRHYVAISPNLDYTSVEIKAFSESLIGVLANGYNLHVYGMCHETDFSGCQEGFSTSWDGSGLSVGITGVGSYGVKDAFKALNNNNNGDYSTLSLGNLSVAGHIQQNIQYTNTVAANTPFRLKMEVGTGTVNVSVFDGIRIVGYKDGVETYNEPLQTAVLGGVSLGTLFNNGGAHDVDFAMDQEVDEIALRLNSLVSATVGVPDVRLYYIVQDCNLPLFTAWKSFKVGNDANIKTVKGGEEVEYTIHVRNTGSVALNDYIVTDAIPANTTYVAGSGGTFANDVVTFTDIDVAAGATTTVSFKVTVNPDLTGVTKISNVALVKKDVADPGTETFPPSAADPNEPKTDGDKGTDIPVDQISSISTWKYAGASQAGTVVAFVSGGETIEYTIYIKNTGNQALTGVKVTEAVPTGTTLAAGSSITFPDLNIAVGATESVTFSVTVNNDLTGVNSISNVATVTVGGTPVQTTPADPMNPIVGPDPNKNPGDPTEVPVAKVGKVTTWKSFIIDGDPSIQTVQGGELVEYTIHIRNTGNTQLTNVKIADELQAGITYVSGGFFDGTRVTFGATGTTPININYGQTITRTFTVRVNADLSRINTISNIATVEGDGLTPTPTVQPDPNDPNEPGGAGTTDIPVVDNSQVTFTKVGANATGAKKIEEGQTLTYVLTVENTGNKDLTNVTVTDPLLAVPSYFTNQVKVNGVAQTVVGGTGVTHTIGGLSVGASATVTIQLTAVANLPDSDPVVNIATVTFTKEDNTTDTETATETVLSDCDPVSASNIDVTPVSSVICLDEQTTFTATLAVGSMPTGADFVWRRGSDNGPIVHKGDTYTVTPSTAGTHTYVVSIEGGRACFQTPGKTVSVTVSPRATADLVTARDIVACADGSINLKDSVYIDISLANRNPVIRFYEQAELLTELVSTTIPTVEGTHTYYVTVSADGLCENAPNTAATLVVTVNPRAVAADIAVAGTTICEGDNTTLTAALSSGKQINNPIFKWYSDAGLTTLVHTGASFTPSPALTVTTSYFVTVQGTGVCENLPAEAKEVAVTVTPRGKAGFITVNGPTEVCEGSKMLFQATLTQPTPQIINPVIRWYKDAALTELIYEGNTFESIADASRIGVNTLYVTVSGDNYCENAVGTAQNHVITVNEMAVVKLESKQTSFAISKGAVLDLWGVSGPTVSPATTTVKWYDQNNAEVDPANVENWLKNISFSAEGTYTLRVEASAGSCVSSTTITITVFDPDQCPPSVQRVYASSQSWSSVITGGVSKEEQAVDGNVKTYSTLTTGVGLLGIGTVWQNLNFGHKVPAGTPVTVKLGKEYSGLMLAGGITVVGYNDDGDIGAIRGVQGAILDLLNADNVVEFTFVPTEGGVAKPYTGVRVIQGALVSVAQNVRLYGAYYTKSGSVNCDPIDASTNRDILDLYHGVRTIGLGVASSLATVKDPWKAVDNNPNTFAEFWAGAGILNEGFITPVFKTRSTATDSLHITLAIPSQPVLSLSLLTNIKIQRYLGNTKVGDAIQPFDQNILGLRLLGLMGDGSQKAILTIPSDGLIYDRVDVAYGKFVSVGGDFVNVYDVALVPKIANVDDGSMSFEVCAADDLRIQMQDGCTTYELFDDKGNSLTTTDNLNFKLPTGVQPGTYTYYVQAKRYDCAVGPRQEITVKVNALPTTSSIKLNDVEQTAITLAPYEQMKVEVTTDATTTIAKWEVNESGTWNEYTVAGTDKTAFTYAVPLKPAGSQVKFRALLTSDKGCDAYTGEIVLNIKAQEVDYDKSKLVVKKGTAVADGSDMNTVEAQIRDKFDMPIAGITVAYTVSGLTGVQTSTLIGTSDANGQFELTLTSEKIGTASITATAGGRAITVGSPALVTFVAGAIDFSLSNIEVIDN
ncbi:Ig-like domain-containing protein, partial [Sphingobacterium yanglingense]|uniref:Ig-like domain-containing protein n=1 Tax=Sphingobacterium yanglingense TaxID=1437280 RepID=UPI0013C2DDAB